MSNREHLTNITAHSGGTEAETNRQVRSRHRVCRRRRTGTAALVLCSALLGLLPLTGTASAAGRASTAQIDGVAKVDTGNVCTEIDDLFTLTLTGSLEGCWYTTVLEVVQTTPSGGYRERGEETFIGCLADGTNRTCGSFDTTYQFEAKYQTEAPFAEIHGRCQHPIVRGTGGFAGITGRVDFKDDIVNSCFYYRGHIRLG